jgi:hypothetical protein
VQIASGFYASQGNFLHVDTVADYLYFVKQAYTIL